MALITINLKLDENVVNSSQSAIATPTFKVVLTFPGAPIFESKGRIFVNVLLAFGCVEIVF